MTVMEDFNRLSAHVIVGEGRGGRARAHTDQPEGGVADGQLQGLGRR